MIFAPHCANILWQSDALLAQLDRVFGYEPKGQGFESLQARHVVDIAQLAERRIVDPNVVGSSPIIHPTRVAKGCRQVARHQTLTLVFVGPNPATPAI